MKEYITPDSIVISIKITDCVLAGSYGEENEAGSPAEEITNGLF